MANYEQFSSDDSLDSYHSSDYDWDPAGMVDGHYIPDKGVPPTDTKKTSITKPKDPEHVPFSSFRESMKDTPKVESQKKEQTAAQASCSEGLKRPASGGTSSAKKSVRSGSYKATATPDKDYERKGYGQSIPYSREYLTEAEDSEEDFLPDISAQSASRLEFRLKNVKELAAAAMEDSEDDEGPPPISIGSRGKRGRMATPKRKKAPSAAAGKPTDMDRASRGPESDDDEGPPPISIGSRSTRGRMATPKQKKAPSAAAGKPTDVHPGFRADDYFDITPRRSPRTPKPKKCDCGGACAHTPAKRSSKRRLEQDRPEEETSTSPNRSFQEVIQECTLPATPPHQSPEPQTTSSGTRKRGRPRLHPPKDSTDKRPVGRPRKFDFRFEAYKDGPGFRDAPPPMYKNRQDRTVSRAAIFQTPMVVKGKLPNRLKKTDAHVKYLDLKEMRRKPGPQIRFTDTGMTNEQPEVYEVADEAEDVEEEDPENVRFFLNRLNTPRTAAAASGSSGTAATDKPRRAKWTPGMLVSLAHAVNGERDRLKGRNVTGASRTALNPSRTVCWTAVALRINDLHRDDVNYTPVTGTQCHDKVTGDLADAKNKVGKCAKWFNVFSGNGGLPPADVVPSQYDEMLMDFAGEIPVFGMENIQDTSIYSGYNYAKCNPRHFWRMDRPKKPEYKTFIDEDLISEAIIEQQKEAQRKRDKKNKKKNKK